MIFTGEKAVTRHEISSTCSGVYLSAASDVGGTAWLKQSGLCFLTSGNFAANNFDVLLLITVVQVILLPTL
jgi:hypothetical protein